MLAKIIRRVEEEVELLQRSPSQEILDAAFEAALNGVREGKMSYKGDRVLPHVVGKIRSEVGKFKSLSAEELRKKTAEVG